MAETYKKSATDSSTGKFGVVYQNIEGEGYAMDPVVYDEESDAEKAAEDRVTAGANRAQVLTPTGPVFEQE